MTTPTGATCTAPNITPTGLNFTSNSNAPIRPR